MRDFPPWIWEIPAYFNIGVACTDAHLETTVADRVAVMCSHHSEPARQATFAQLADATGRFNRLLRDLGLRAGERVLIRLPNCLQFSVVFLGAMKRGAIPVPTSPLLTPEELGFLAQDSGACAIVTDPESWSAMQPALDAQPAMRHVIITGPPAAERVTTPQRAAITDLDVALSAVAAAEPHPTRAEDPAYLVYTSGTTGYPKGVLHAHRALLGRQPASRYWFDFQLGGDRVLHSGKYNWTYVLGTGLTDPLYQGSTAIVHEGPSDAALWPRLIAQYAATIFIAVPTIYRQIIQKTALTGEDVPSLRHCMSAGEHLSDEVLAAWRRRFNLDIFEGLGMTECSYYLCQTKSRPIRAGTVGFAQPGHHVAILDPATLTEVGPDREGMLCIGRDDPGLLLRYWRSSEENAASYRGDWFLTGDYAQRDADGYIWFLGRKDDLIKSFGYRVSPYEIERVLKDHPDVTDAAVAGEELEPTKILVAAYVIRRPGSSVTAEDLIAYCRTRLAAYKSPRLVHFVDDFPRTRNGKILRRSLAPARAESESTQKRGDAEGPE